MGLLELITVTVAVADVVEVVVVVVSTELVGADPMLVKPAGMQRDPPQLSPSGQQAVTPLKTQVG